MSSSSPSVVDCFSPSPPSDSAAVLALASFAQATITINTDSLTANTTDTIQWTSTDLNNDPESFSIELTNTLFHDNFAIGNNIQTTTGSFTFEMPVVPAGYVINIPMSNGKVLKSRSAPATRFHSLTLVTFPTSSQVRLPSPFCRITVSIPTGRDKTYLRPQHLFQLANTTTPGSSSVSGVTTASFASSATP